jgi:hypothetical protein
MWHSRGRKKARKNAVSAPRSEIVPAIMLQHDVLNLICEKLSVNDLLLCSLVCRVFLRTIDANFTTYFNQSLRWWSICEATHYSDFSIMTRDSSTMTYNTQRGQYEQMQALSPKWQRQWLMYTVPRVGAIVHMRMHLQIALDYVVLSGKDDDVKAIRDRGVASIDALEWEIIHVTMSDKVSSICRGTTAQVHMQVIGFIHNNRRVSLKMLRSMVVTFQDVPVLDCPIPHRALCVIKCVRQCMHCNQRASKWQSVDVVHPEHRVLCSVCIEHLFVEEKKMQTKWKIKRILPAEADNGVRRCFFSHRTLDSNKPIVFLLKRDVAVALGHSDWTELLVHNRQQTVHNRLWRTNRFSHFHFSTRWLV